ncbi:MAG: tetratricopeptide repeat protein [Candidatus Calescibacterium sp.]|nr:tetratricopeptide repeat protein [Candidatus Calescibacterium sp.]
MSKVFIKLSSIVNYYKNLIDKDPFVQLNLVPLNYDIPTDNDSKYADFLRRYGKEYINQISSSFLSLPDMYIDVLKDAEKKGLIEEIKKNRGLKISDAKLELSQNIIVKGLFDKYEQDKFKAAYSFKLSYDFYKNKNYIDAKKSLEESLKYDPNNPYVIFNLFIINYLLGNFDKVQELLNLMFILGFNEVDFFLR